MWKWPKRVFPSEHEWAAQQLSAYLDSELSTSDRARVEAHLRECHPCAAELHALRWTVSLAAQMPMLKAPHSFLVTEATAQPRRMALGVAYAYLRSATVAAVALLSLVLASDFLLPYALSPRVAAPPRAARQPVPAAEELRVEVEAVREVRVTKEVEKRPPPTAPAAVQPVEVERVLVEVEAPKEEPETKIGLEAEPLAEEAMKPKAMAARAVPTEQAPKVDAEAAVGAGKAEQPAAAEESAVPSPLATPAPSPAGILPTPHTATPTPPTPTPPLRYQTAQAEEAVPPPQPTLSRAVADAGRPSEPTARPSPPYRSALRLTEVGLALLVIALVASTLILRPRL